MVIVLLLFFSCSIFLNLYFLQKRKAATKEIRYIEEKLGCIIDQQTDEKILHFTSNTSLQQLLFQINRLLELNQQKQAEFYQTEHSMRTMLSNISHDLKTPLTVILGYSEMVLNDRTLSIEKQQVLLQTVHGKTTEVIDMINRFFELVKLESADHNLEMSKIEAGEICRKIMLEFYEILTAKEFEVTIQIPDEPFFVRGNSDALERILHNLLANAIAYGADGKMVGLTVSRKDTFVQIQVIDKGKGIQESDQNRVFERLYTLEDSRNKLYQGSGLGLTITKRLTEQLGGRISLDSTPFEKTVFTVELPTIDY